MLQVFQAIVVASVLTSIMVLRLWLHSFNQVTSPAQSIPTRHPTNTNKEKWIPSDPPRSSDKDFIYLVQTESCLSSYLMQRGLLDGETTTRKVVVLSWKNPCTTVVRYKHEISYLYKSRTTWSEGRNLLYRFAKALPEDYLYYVFLDDDMQFYFTNVSHKQRYLDNGIRSPLYAFEEFLRSHEPAVGMPMHCSRCLRRSKIAGDIVNLCCDKMNEMEPLPDYLPVTIHFDAAFNAFHKDAVDFLLPYRLDYENKSWWESQKFIILHSDILFRGQVLRFSPVTVVNVQHRTYPKLELDNWRAIDDVLRSETPMEYRSQMSFIPNSSNVDIFPVVKDNIVYTPTWNVTIPRTRTPVIPYKHFKN